MPVGAGYSALVRTGLGGPTSLLHSFCDLYFLLSKVTLFVYGVYGWWLAYEMACLVMVITHFLCVYLISIPYFLCVYLICKPYLYILVSKILSLFMVFMGGWFGYEMAWLVMVITHFLCVYLICISYYLKFLSFLWCLWVVDLVMRWPGWLWW